MSLKSPVTTHILDLGSGNPAAGVSVSLYRIKDQQETSIAQGTTDNDGRVMNWFDTPIEPGHYRLRFATGDWYQSRGLSTFFPEVCLDFQVNDPDAHYHVPLLLNQWGFSTYRGS
ncbi:MAG: hydroxyisourate hydrolase [Marinobacter sp.]|uniref:hydroxyisourate hydrolase n=1 Tax=Marinobacter sp. TaxID=50741 RepID=UPI001B774B5F|nr:hydroxyisourate hydrolase [Marinobacter sp.]MBQ0748367.1 hydroxyisourate hydrolase [Marinobacter sp.]MBQ0812754.1 hydroxyisourate hydrolase [Marinobacter sp.]